MTEAVDKASVARNTAWSVGGFVLQLLTPLLMTPYILTRVSLETYGVWIALLSLSSWLGLFDLGIWGPLTRDVAEHRAAGDRAALKQLWSTWLWFDLVCGAAIVAATFFGSPLILRLVLPGTDPAGLSAVLVGLVLQAVLSPLMRHLMYTLNGFQRMDLTNLVGLVVTPLWVVGQVVLLESGWGLLGLTASGVFFALVQIAAFTAFVIREGYPATLSPAGFSFARLKGLMQFGWKLQMNQWLGQAFRSDRVLLGVLGTPLSAIAVYQFGAVIMDRLSGGITVLSSAVLPATSDLVARGERDRVTALFLRGTKYHAISAVGLLGFAALFAPELLTFWLKSAPPGSAAVLRIMLLGGLATAIGSCGQAIAVGLGRPGLTAVSSAAGLAATVFLYMIAGRRYDYLGLAASVSIGLAAIQIVFMSGLHRILEFRWREYVGNALLKPAVLAVPLAGVWAGWSVLGPHLPPVDTRLRAFAVLAPAFLLSTLLGWAIARAFRVIDDYDLDVLRFPGRRASA